jgi:hypothetical protein
MTIATELEDLLRSDQCGERQIHAFLKENSDLVRSTFATSWNYAEVFSEVSFGSEYRVDFLVLCANSGHWIAHAIELKSPIVPLYKKNGDKSADLQLVERQVAQRIDWRRANEGYFRATLSKLVKPSDSAMCSNVTVHTRAKSELRDPHTYIDFDSHAVIGRSSTLSDEERERRRQDEQHGAWGSTKVLTYDRLLSVAKRFYDK